MMYHPKCTTCRSSKTVKFGLPRWKCAACSRTFRVRQKKRLSRSRIEAYVEDRATYARLGKRWKVHRSTAYRRVMRAITRRIALIERTKKLLRSCDGVCVLDAKHVRINGKRYTLFIAWDRGLGRPIHFLLKEGGEKELWYWRLLLDLKRIGYAPSGFISDGISVLREFLAEAYPGLPHQRCAVHVFMAVKSKVAPGRRRNARQTLFLELVKRVLWSRDLRTALRRLEKLSDTRGLNEREHRALICVWNAVPECFVCVDPRWKHLQLPRSSNSIENVIGNVEARFKTMRGLKSPDAVSVVVNDILLRTKRQNINQ